MSARHRKQTPPVLDSKSSLAAAVESDPRWAAVRGRDGRVDGTFVYSVATTGVYCRPSCAARCPRPENVRFHAGPLEAEAAGFRACKRCRPDGSPLSERRAAAVAELCRALESGDETPSLQELARRAGLSVFHTHRLFKSVTGLTPRAYAAAHRANRVRRELRRQPSITEAIYEAGYGSSGRFYESADALLGMTPTSYRAGGSNVEIRVGHAACSLGALLVAATDRGLCAILLGDDSEALMQELEQSFPRARRVEADLEFTELVAKVVGLVEDPRGSAAQLPLDIRGTVFQQRVWQALCRITPGRTATYAELAVSIGASGSARAVARACSANKLAVAIPCHRAVRGDGAPSGYRWGAERKRALLAREALPIPP